MASLPSSPLPVCLPFLPFGVLIRAAAAADLNNIREIIRVRRRFWKAEREGEGGRKRGGTRTANIYKKRKPATAAAVEMELMNETESSHVSLGDNVD